MIHIEEVPPMPLLPDELRKVCTDALVEEGWEVSDSWDLYIEGACPASLWRIGFDFYIDFKLFNQGIAIRVRGDTGPDHKFVDVLAKPIIRLCQAIEDGADKYLESLKREPVGDPMSNESSSSKYEVFISYAREDSRFAQKVRDDLFLCNIASWIDRNSLRMGDKWPDTIKQAIDARRALILIISPEALNSAWVKKEIKHAAESNKLVVPIIHKKTELTPWFTRQMGNIEQGDFTKEKYGPSLRELVDVIKENLGK